MVSLDDAVVARWEYGGKRYEVLLDPDMVEAFREDPTSVNLDDFMAVEDVFHDARQGERPAVEDLVSTFGSEDVAEATAADASFMAGGHIAKMNEVKGLAATYEMTGWMLPGPGAPKMEISGSEVVEPIVGETFVLVTLRTLKAASAELWTG